MMLIFTQVKFWQSEISLVWMQLFHQDNSKLLFDSTTVCGHFNKILLPTFIKFLQAQGTDFDRVCFSSLQYCTMTGMITCGLTGMTRMTRINWDNLDN